MYELDENFKKNPIDSLQEFLVQIIDLLQLFTCLVYFSFRKLN